MSINRDYQKNHFAAPLLEIPLDMPLRLDPCMQRSLRMTVIGTDESDYDVHPWAPSSFFFVKSRPNCFVPLCPKFSNSLLFNSTSTA